MLINIINVMSHILWDINSEIQTASITISVNIFAFVIVSKLHIPPQIIHFGDDNFKFLKQSKNNKSCEAEKRSSQQL